MPTTRQTSRTSRSPHTQHRDRVRCSNHKQQILDLLLAYSPNAPHLDDLRSITTRLSARIEELRADGWSIEALRVAGRLSTYRLLSKVKGAPIQYAAAVTIHLPVHGEATARTHEKIVGGYRADLLDYAAEQAKRAYLRALGRGAPPPKVEAVSNDSDSDFDGGVW